MPSYTWQATPRAAPMWGDDAMGYWGDEVLGRRASAHYPIHPITRRCRPPAAADQTPGSSLGAAFWLQASTAQRPLRISMAIGSTERKMIARMTRVKFF